MRWSAGVRQTESNGLDFTFQKYNRWFGDNGYWEETLFDVGGSNRQFLHATSNAAEGHNNQIKNERDIKHKSPAKGLPMLIEHVNDHGI